MRGRRGWGRSVHLSGLGLGEVAGIPSAWGTASRTRRLQTLLVAGGGAVAGGLLFATLMPLPTTDPVSLGAGLARSFESSVFSWACALLGYAAFGGVTATLVEADLRTRRLPNRVTAVGTLSTVSLLALSSLLDGEGGWALVPAFTAVLYAGAGAALWWRRPDAVGGGDIKLMPVAAYAGVWGLPRGSWLLGTFAFGAMLSLAFLIVGAVALARRRSSVAAAPAILGAAWATFGVAALLARPW